VNGVDTETEGVDVVIDWPVQTEKAGRFDFTVTGNWNSTDVTRTTITDQLADLGLPETALFSRFNVLTFEEGTPADKFSASVNWQLAPFGASLRAIRYGEVLSPATNNNPDLDTTLSDKTLVDVELRFDIVEKVRLAIGADNVFDEYPDPFTAPNNTTGATSFSNYSPFGRSGRFIYGRLSVDF
jgi:iron complex outermembrane recepter protein